MAGDDMFFEGALAWFNTASAEVEDISQGRALQWLQTPEARVVAKRIVFNTGSPGELIKIAESAVRQIDLPPWEQAVEADQFMRGLLEGLARSMINPPS